MKSHLTAAALAVAALCASVPASAAIALTFTPSATHVNIGDTVTVDVGITGLGTEILAGFDLNFVYSTSVLTWIKTSFFGAQFPNPFPDPIGILEVPGNLGYDIISLDDDATIASIQTDDAFQLFTFEFTGAGNGTTQFTLGGGANDRLFLGSIDNASGSPIELAVNVGSVCIEVGTGSCNGGGPTIPEPATYGLVAVALFAAGVTGRRRRSPGATTS